MTEYNYKNDYYYTVNTHFGINSTLFGAGASSIEELLNSFLEEGKGSNAAKSLKFLTKFGILSTVASVTVDVVFNGETATVGGTVINLAGEFALDTFIAAALVAAGATPGLTVILGAAVGSSLIISGANSAWEEINLEVDSFYEDLFNGSLVDLKFLNSSGEHSSGIMLPTGSYETLGIRGSIISYLTQTTESVDGGYLTFNDGRDGDAIFDTEYHIENGSKFQTIASNLGISLTEFLNSGIGESKNSDIYIDSLSKIIYEKHNDFLVGESSKFYIPVTINGVVQIIAVDGVNDNGTLIIGRDSEIIYGTTQITYPDTLYLNKDSNSPIIITSGRSEGNVEGTSIVIGSGGNDNIANNNNSDKIYKSATIDGGDGVDTIDYGSLSFGSRDITVNLQNHTATNGIALNAFNNTIYNIENIIASNGDDTIIGNDSINTLKGSDGHDFISGGKGNDFLYGDSGSDSLSGDEGKDFLSGGADNDSLSGGADNDTLLGNDGDDILNGGIGNDLLQGGAGFDTYSVTESLLGIDVINDSDRSGQILIDGNILTGEAKYVVYEDDGLHQLNINGHNYYLKMNGGMLFIARNEENITAMKADNNVIVIQSFTNGQFGITLEHPEKEGEIGSGIGDFLRSIGLGEATQPVLRYDPLTLDLDGDGIELVSLSNSNTFFDLDNDGLRENVGWVKADDGILILDENNNGTVDNIEELFGYRNPNGTEVTGTQELATHDSNHDGKIDNNDAIFSQLKLWQDLNQDGISQENELKSLTDYQITSIDVNLNNLNQLNQNVEGNVIISTGTYTKEVTQTTTDENGNIITITTQVTNQYANLDLAIDQTNSSHYDYQDNAGNNITYDLNIDTLFLPQSRGYGNTVAWHIAMSQDGTLLSIMQDAVNLTK